MHTNTVPRLAQDPPRPLPGSMPAALCRSLFSRNNSVGLPALPTLPSGLRSAQAMTLRSIGLWPMCFVGYPAPSGAALRAKLRLWLSRWLG